MDDRELLNAAQKAREKSYCPYSGFSVGAALLGKSGKVYLGCNVESAAYPATNCAERTAFFKAVSEGEREFSSIAVIGGKAGEQPNAACPPCGMCRQVMMEFCDPKTFRIILCGGTGEPKGYTLEELLPLGFGPAQLKG